MTASFVVSIQPFSAALLIEYDSAETRLLSDPAAPYPAAPPALGEFNPGAPPSPPASVGMTTGLAGLNQAAPPALAFSASAEPDPPAHPLDNESEFACYREATTYLLRRYLRQSIEVGRLPNILGREILPSNASHIALHTFEDQVIFVHDMERCIDRLPPDSRQLISVIVLQEFSPEEAVVRFGWHRASVFRGIDRALDEMTELLLRYGLMDPFPGHEIAKILPTSRRREKNVNM
jgi:hypothetical protein